jgi:hypothetical protein
MHRVAERASIALALLAAAVLALIVATAPKGALPRTAIIANVTPFTADGHLRSDLRIVQRTTGTCEPGSDTLPNNVYRCFFQSVVADPCWRDYRAVTPAVICLQAPWDRTVVRLRLAAAPAPSHGHTDLKAEPWGISLQSGARCLAFQGAHDTLTGKEGSPVIDYYCGRALALVRGIDRSHQPWTIRAARITHQLSHPYALVGRVPIRTAWFGGNNPLSRRP